ncbi:MAG: P-II family nitrogen regulator [Gammaproteobacteria bacterium]
MIEIKAFIHRARAADVIRALKNAEFRNLTVIDVKGMLKSLDDKEQNYSIELAEAVITEVKLEFVCEDQQESEAVNIIREHGHTGQEIAGWIYISSISNTYAIDGK